MTFNKPNSQVHDTTSRMIQITKSQFLENEKALRESTPAVSEKI